jgi:hypothetical protein
LTSGYCVLFDGVHMRFRGRFSGSVDGNLRVPRRLVLFVPILLAPVAAMTPSSLAAVSSCRVVPHDAARPVRGLPRELDVTCDTAISLGHIVIRVNRGIPSSRVVAQVSNGSGQLTDCIGINGGGSGTRPAASIDCRASLSANATAKLFTLFSMPASPCDSPSLKGTLKVTFGGGSSFGPSALPRYGCASRRHRRAISLAGVGQEGPGAAGATGFLKAKDGFTKCSMRVPIVLQRRAGGRWLTVGRATTGTPNQDGQAPWFIHGIPLRGGTYRAVAHTKSFGNQVCVRAVSRTVGGPPGV